MKTVNRSRVVMYARLAAAVFGAAWVSQAFAVTLPDDAHVTNPISAFEITVDGLFSGGVSGGSVIGEWSDVTPLAFIAPPDDTGDLLRTSLDDPNANSHLYAAIAPGVAALDFDGLYLMYDYLDRTNPIFEVGSEIARIRFLHNIGGNQRLVNVLFLGAGAGGIPVVIDPEGDGTGEPVDTPIDSFFDVFVDVDLDGALGPNPIQRLPGSFFGFEGAIGFGPSALGSAPHMLIELEVPLLIPPDFGSGFPTGGIPGEGGNGYSPDPSFWGAAAKNDAVDPPISSAIFTINPDGSTTLDSSNVQQANVIPEPVTAGLSMLGLGAVVLASAVRRRER